MTDLNFLKLLKDKKVADSFQFFSSCKYKLDIAELNYKALNNIIIKYQHDETEAVQKAIGDAINTGERTCITKKDTVDFFGIEISATTAMEKLVIEIMGLLHSFFDTFAQWINSSLFGEKALLLEDVSLSKVIGMLPNFTEHTGQFITSFLNISTTNEFRYISDFNNIQKHHYQLYIKNKFDIFTMQGEVSMPDFKKKKKLHIKEDALSAILSRLNYCKKLLSDSQKYIENYYKNNECSYKEHRFYNPKTYMLFENKEDYEQMKNLKNSYYYIEVDPSNILPQYQIMLVYDGTGVDIDEGKRIDLYNSVYSIIMLKDCVNDNIVGILKPEDDEIYSINDEHNLIYRKYKSITTDYQLDVHETMYSTCNYYPSLSDLSVYWNKKEDERGNVD